MVDSFRPEDNPLQFMYKSLHSLQVDSLRPQHNTCNSSSDQTLKSSLHSLHTRLLVRNSNIAKNTFSQVFLKFFFHKRAKLNYQKTNGHDVVCNRFWSNRLSYNKHPHTLPHHVAKTHNDNHKCNLKWCAISKGWWFLQIKFNNHKCTPLGLLLLLR
jgi:hypothetical protein